MEGICFDHETPMKTIFEFAISKEVEGQRFYAWAAKRAKDPGAKAMFDELAAVEVEHQKVLQKRYAEIGCDGEAPGGKGDLGINEELIETEFDADMNPQQAIELAIKKEQSAVELYAYAADRFPDPALKEIFNRMKVDEEGHKRALQEELDRAVSPDF